MRLGQDKGRTIQKNLETLSGYNILVQFEASAEEKIAILSNLTTRNRVQHTTCDLYAESSMHED